MQFRTNGVFLLQALRTLNLIAVRIFHAEHMFAQSSVAHQSPISLWCDYLAKLTPMAVAKFIDKKSKYFDTN